jgi:hypothetical protein
MGRKACFPFKRVALPRGRFTTSGCIRFDFPCTRPPLAEKQESKAQKTTRLLFPYPLEKQRRQLNAHEHVRRQRPRTTGTGICGRCLG